MKCISSRRWFGLFAATVVVTLTAACSALWPTVAPQPTIYTLGGNRIDTGPPAPKSASVSADLPTLIVDPPRAAAGFDSLRIIYVRKPQQLEYFAHSEWVDTPARMLAPLIVSAIARSTNFGAVVLAPGAIAGDMRLDTEIVRMQQEFDVSPSRVRFTLRATLVDTATSRVLVQRELEASVSAESQDPYGGIIAAQAAVAVVMEDLASICTEAAAGWPGSHPQLRRRDTQAQK